MPASGVHPEPLRAFEFNARSGGVAGHCAIAWRKNILRRRQIGAQRAHQRSGNRLGREVGDELRRQCLIVLVEFDWLRDRRQQACAILGRDLGRERRTDPLGVDPRPAQHSLDCAPPLERDEHHGSALPPGAPGPP